ncbi:MAG: ATP-binding cassette domain-containing protein, partial [Pseudomonadota bacterium]
EAARRGLARTFQIVQPFPKMTVLENVAAGAVFAGAAGSMAEAREAAARELAFVGLDTVADTPASALTLPNRKRLELAKSLAMRPRVLLLDEVNAGLNPAEIDGALALIRQIAGRGVTILIIEHREALEEPPSLRHMRLAQPLDQPWREAEGQFVDHQEARARHQPAPDRAHLLLAAYLRDDPEGIAEDLAYV